MSAPACAVSLGAGVEVAGVADGDAERLARRRGARDGFGPASCQREAHHGRDAHAGCCAQQSGAMRGSGRHGTSGNVAGSDPGRGYCPLRDALLPHRERGGIVGHDTVHAERGDLIPLRVAVERVDDDADAGRVQLVDDFGPLEHGPPIHDQPAHARLGRRAHDIGREVPEDEQAREDRGGRPRHRRGCGHRSSTRRRAARDCGT